METRRADPMPQPAAASAFPADRGGPPTDALTRWVAGIVLVFLLDALQLLLLLPDRTEALFAWRIEPTATSFALASAYAGGAYYFARVLLGAPWHRVAPGMPAVIMFVWFAAAATFLHLDRFVHGNLAFAAWVALYAVTPFAIPALYVRAMRRASPPRGGRPLPDGLRRALGGAGGVLVAVAIAFLLSPATAMDVWPWELTPLTARILAAVIALFGAVWLSVAVDGTRAGARIPLEAHAIGLAVLAAAGVRGDAPAVVAAALLLLAADAGARMVGGRE